MSAFDDEVRSDMTSIFQDAGFLADYQITGGAVLLGKLVVLDRNWEPYSDDQQLAGRINTISVMVADVPSSNQGDTIQAPGKTWIVEEVLEDDGHVRRLWVT
ncbi:hypothetical protein NDQ72_10945 [Halomonas sp. KG2]|uniref:head-tail joining protein n=1 Tax=Halomonas sp. KG2 TaxID=2951138 RepID=UPI002648B018|nr:hypothetical protein [Halomonas sp. KG2]WKD26591.1 hypothetical protein NDQ72_10945 [Halomonas sp. KG2]